MDIFSLQFATALASIVVIDLVLAGDNAIVIALAARNVPRHLQRRAMVWGAAGAVIVRSLLTLIVVWLLKFPGLLFLGGALLVWIAYQLLAPEEHDEAGPSIQAASTFWGAIRTIVMADLVMGLDNVLGVAGAAHGNFVLVVLGLLISVPILVWGSSVLLRYVERYPSLVYVGAAVLAFTAAKMMSSEPMLADAMQAYAFTVPAIYVVTVFGVLWSGFVASHRRLESRISARLADLNPQNAVPLGTLDTGAVEGLQVRILVPVDGTRNSQHAVRHVIRSNQGRGGLEVHLLNVQTPLSRNVAQFVDQRIRTGYYRDKAEKALRSMHKLLDSAGIPHSTHMEIGNKAEIIAKTAKRLGCRQIVMATARKNSLTRMLESSVTNQVLEQATVPVEVVPGDSVSSLDRYGVPAVVAIVIGLMLIQLLT